MNYNVPAYLLYLAITTFVVIFVGSLFFRQGAPFLLSVFCGDAHLAPSVNRFLLAGYYLINIGYCSITLRGWQPVENMLQVTERVASKAGLIILLLGIIHMFNITVLLAIGRRIRNKKNIQY